MLALGSCLNSTVVSSPLQQLRKDRPGQCLPRAAAVRPRGLQWKGCFLWLNAAPEMCTHQVQRQRRLSRGRPAHHLAVEERDSQSAPSLQDVHVPKGARAAAPAPSPSAPGPVTGTLSTKPLSALSLQLISS